MFLYQAIRFEKTVLGSIKLQENVLYKLQSIFTLNIFVRRFRKKFGLNVQFNKLFVHQMVDIKIKFIVDNIITFITEFCGFGPEHKFSKTDNYMLITLLCLIQGEILTKMVEVFSICNKRRGLNAQRFGKIIRSVVKVLI